ncbi:MAG: hypothetical protein DSZ08_00745 [Sulfurovum sp.]|nr:MAG: hypothetical protein DSZ08_00745 [Sulfurovum sp.]
MCIPAYYKYLFFAIVVGTLVILAIFYNRIFYMIPVFVFSIIWSRVLCPNCHQSLLKNEKGWYVFTMRSTCRHCGYDTLLCDKNT